MKTKYLTSFTRDLKRIKDSKLQERVQRGIEQVKAARTLLDIEDIKKMGGAEDCYRIRVGDFRICIVVEGDTVEFVRFLNRRDVYKYFP